MELSLKEQRKWPQKCELQWLREGDEILLFFHKWTSIRKSKSLISILEKEDGILLNLEEEIEKEVVNFFANLYRITEGQRFVVENIQ